MLDFSVLQGDAAFGFMLIALIIIFGPQIAERLRLPGLLGLLVGGALIGPNLFNVLEDFRTLQAIGDIGVLYLIFLSGLQLDLETFARNWRSSMGFGLLTGFIPMVLGIAAALFLGFETSAAVLIGSFWASFTLIAYPVVTQYGLTKNPAISATIGASSITDTISLIILAIVVGAQTGEQVGSGLLLSITLGLVLVAAYCLLVLPVVVRWFFAAIGHDRQLRFMFVMVGMTSSAVVANILGIEPLIGAFFAGVGLNRSVPNESQLMERTDFFGNALFIPTFMVSVGLLFDPAVMFVGSTIRLAIFFGLALIVGKAIAAWLSGRLFQFTQAEVGLMFSISTAQAAATLAATVIGLGIGLYGEDVVNAVMVVIVISLFITSIGSNYFAPQVEVPEEAERRLGERVIVPVTGQETELAALLALGGRLAEASGGVLAPLVVAVPDDRETSIVAKRAQLATINETMHSLGLTGDAQLRVDHSVAGGVSRAALEQDASLVLVDWPGPRDVRSYVLGANNDAIVAAANVPVAAATIHASSFARIVLVVGEEELARVRHDDLRWAVKTAVTLAGGGDRLVVGPVQPGQIQAAGIELPDSAKHAPGSSNPGQWASENTQESDLVVVPARGRPFSTFDGDLSQRGRSVLVVAARPSPAWYGTEGTLGIPLVRTG